MMQLLYNFIELTMVFGNIMTVIGASYKVIEIIDYQPKINTTGGIKVKEGSNGEI
jgi:hypothetical protein